ncbi:class I SAM-dependent methyltransferase [Enterococcus sp. LJL51]|uniref:class I SAM-dependent methyltransferase n=1 Tax=Enterococcus sp. LJL51 TaxID=3416656 RepID=UPI003CE84705
MRITFDAVIPAVDSGRLLMKIPAEAAAGLEKETTQKVRVTINDKTYICNLLCKMDGFYLHIISKIKKDIGLGAPTSFTLESIDNNEEKQEGIHGQVLAWETTTCKSLMQKVGMKKDARVIDFGCGYGHYTIGCSLALEQTGEVFAVDCDAKALKWIKEKEQRYAIHNIKTIHTNGASALDFPDNSIDVILLYDIVHIQDKESKNSMASILFKEAYRVLKKGGILSTLNFSGDLKKMMIENEKKAMTVESIEREILETGFEYSHSVADGIHFDWYHSKYRLEKGLLFSELERGHIYNYVKPG